MNNNPSYYTLQPCMAKRPWTLPELQANDPSKVFGLKTRYLKLFKYVDIERHCCQKLEELKLQNLQFGSNIPYIRDDYVNPTNNNVDAIPAFYGVFTEVVGNGDNVNNGIGGDGLDNSMMMFGGEDPTAPSSAPREWTTFELVAGGMDQETPMTLMDAMQLPNGDNPHHLCNIQRAMNLPETYEFGDVLDAVFRSIIEDMVFVHSCRLVHRNRECGGFYVFLWDYCTRCDTL